MSVRRISVLPAIIRGTKRVQNHVSGQQSLVI